MYANFGKKVFIDLVYEISQNTLEQEGDLPCNSDLDRTYDDCLYAEIANDLGILIKMPSFNLLVVC